MPLKTSYFKKEIWKQGFRNSGWIGIAYFIALFFVLPLNILMEKSRQGAQNVTHHELIMESLIHFNIEFQVVLYLFVPVLAAVFSSRYMQVKGSADFYHSLPVRRAHLFTHQFSLGYILLIVPLLLIAFLLFIMYGTMDVDSIYKQADIWNWLVIAWMMNTVIYTFTYFIGMLTGISIIQGLLSLILLFFPAGIVMLITFNIEQLLFGFDSSYFWGSEWTNLSPVIWLMDNMYEDINLSDPQLLYYFGISIASTLLAYWLYKVRDVEAANQSLAFPVLKPFFKIGVTFCFMLLGGAYFGVMQGNYLSWLFFGYVFGSLLGYVLSEMLIQKTWRIFHQWKAFLIYIGISFVVLFSIVFDLFGYETRVPSGEEIEEIYISDGMMQYQMESDRANITNPELFEHVIDLHQYVIDNEELQNNNHLVYGPDATDITITYYLENGRELNRNYYIPNRETIQQYLEPITESDSYKRSSVEWLYDKTNTFDILHVSGMNGSREILDKELISKLRDTLRVDYLNASSEEIQLGHHAHRTTFEFYGDNRYYLLPLLNSFENTKEVLEEQNITELLEVDASDVRMVAITNSTDNTEMLFNLPFSEEIDPDNWLTTNDKDQIEEIIQAKEKETIEGTWEIGLYGPERELYITSFRLKEEDVPRFAIKYFE